MAKSNAVKVISETIKLPIKRSIEHHAKDLMTFINSFIDLDRPQFKKLTKSDKHLIRSSAIAYAKDIINSIIKI